MNTEQDISGMSDYVEDSNSEPENLKRHMICMQSFPCSTAECERGFSLMNNIATDKTAVLSVSNIASLMLISVNDQCESDPTKVNGSFVIDYSGVRNSLSGLDFAGC